MKAIERWKVRGRCVLGVLAYSCKNPKSPVTRGTMITIVLTLAIINSVHKLVGPSDFFRLGDQTKGWTQLLSLLLWGLVIVGVIVMVTVATSVLRRLGTLSEVQTIHNALKQESEQQSSLKQAQKERAHLEAMLRTDSQFSHFEDRPPGPAQTENTLATKSNTSPVRRARRL